MTQEQATRGARRGHTPMPTKGDALRARGVSAPQASRPACPPALSSTAPAGPRRSVPSVLEEHPRRAARRFRLRALAGALLLAVAGFLALAAPAEAQTQIWSATLSPQGITSDEDGCWNGFTGQECSNSSILSGDDFSHNNVTYTISRLTVASLFMTLAFTAELGTAADSFTLNVDGTAFTFADGISSGSAVQWILPGISWSSSDTVSVSITASSGVETPTSPTITDFFISSFANQISSTGVDTYRIGDWIEVLVSFSEEVAVTGDPQLALNIGGETRQAGYDENEGAGVLSFRYQVQNGDEDTDGFAIDADALTLNGGTITAGSTSATLIHAAEAANPDHKVDGVRPMLLSAETSTDGATVILTYDDQLATSGLSRSSFPVTVAGTTRDVSSAAASGTAATLTLASPVAAGQTVTLLYFVGLRSEAIRDLVGNLAPGIYTELEVVNNAIAADPATIDRIEIFSADRRTSSTGVDTYRIGDRIQLDVGFSEEVTVTGTPQLALNIGGETRMADFDYNQGDGYLRFEYRVARNDEDTDGIAIDADALTLNGGTITAGGTSATLTHPAEADDPDQKVDGVRPMFLSAETSADGATVILTFAEQLAAIDLAPGHFTVNVAGSARAVSSAAASGTAATLTLASPVTAGQTVRVGYSGTTGRSSAIQDLPGNTAAAIASTQPVINNVVNTPPEFPESIPDVSMPENSVPGLDIGDPVVATDADGHTLTYSLLQGSGTDGSSFDIDLFTGQLRTRSGVTYSYEEQRSFIVRVMVDDGNGGTDGVFVEIELTDVAEPPLAPDPPTVSPVPGSSDRLSVSWTAPDNTGKPDIDSYDLQYRKGTSGPFTDGPQAVADTMATIDGLDANASYQVRVRATNDEGDGPWSSAGTGSTSADTTPPTLTSAYSGPEDLGAAVHLIFSEDLDVDNLPFASAFRLTADGSPVAINLAQIGNSDNEFVLLALAPVIRMGQTVVVTYIDPTLGDDSIALQDTAGNDVANFTRTLENNSTQVPAAPGAPTGLGATAAGQTRIDLAWTAPADNGGRAISGYRIEWSGAGADPWTELVADTDSTETTYADTGLAAGTTRHYRVAAINAVGTGAASAAASATTTTATPGPPQNLRATAGTGKVTLAWQAPAHEGASAITHYEYQRAGDSGVFGSWTTAETVAFGSNSSSAILRDATTLDDYDVRAQTFYTYRVRAVNAAGNGAVSEFNSATTGAALTVKVEVAEPNVAENEGPVAVTVVAELPATGPNEEKYDLEFQVDVFTAGISTTIRLDYTSLALEATFMPGEFQMESGRWVASKPFMITLVNDAVVEPDETFFVGVERAHITDPSHPFITFPGATDEVTVTIVNDDVPKWAVSVAPATIAEAAGTATVTVSTGGVTFAAAQTIDLSFEGGSATAGTDFTVADANGNALTSPYALTLPMGDSSVTATITAVDDLVDDDDEQIQVTATQNGDKLGEAQTLTIIDDDTASTGIELGLNPASVTENGGAQTITVTAALDGTPRATATDVTVSRTGGTATSGTDYAAVSDFTITIPAASTSATGTFSFAPTDDTVAEGAETVILTGSATGLGSATATLTITDDDEPAITLAFEIEGLDRSNNEVERDEDAGTITIGLRAETAVAAPIEDFEVMLGTVDRNAGSPGDFVAPALTYAFGAADFVLENAKYVQTVTKEIQIVDDEVVEKIEYFEVNVDTGGLPGHVTIPSIEEIVVVEIHDEDTTSVRVVESDVSVEEGEEFELTLALDHEVAFPLTVRLRISTTDGTGMTDLYLEPDETSGQVISRSTTFSARQRQATLTIGTVEDRVVEAEVSLDVTLFRGGLDDAIALINDPVTTITILDDDVPAWTVSVAPDTIAEAAGTATVTVSTGGVTFAAAQTIDLSFDGGSATAGTDFTVADANGNPLTSPYALTLPMGESTVTATITAVDDLVDDDDEQIQVTATQNGDKLGEAQTITITADTAQPAAVAFTSGPGDDDTYAIGDPLKATVTFGAAVTVTGVPQLTLQVGGETRTADYESGTGSTDLVFSYTVAEGDEDTDGVAVEAGTIALNGGTIQVGTTDAALAHEAEAANPAHKVDGIRPTLASATVAADGASITLVFDEPFDNGGFAGLITFGAPPASPPTAAPSQSGSGCSRWTPMASIGGSNSRPSPRPSRTARPSSSATTTPRPATTGTSSRTTPATTLPRSPPARAASSPSSTTCRRPPTRR